MSAPTDWTQWAGGECPLDGNACVLIDVRDEPFLTHHALEQENNVCLARELDWSHNGEGEDILFYRVVRL